MFEFTKKGWEANRGTGRRINFVPKEGQIFKEDDSIKLNVYRIGEFESKPLLSKTAIINTENNTAVMEITNKDMEFEELFNKKQKYLYEVKMNGATIIGSDGDGDKILTLYPEGSED